MILFGVPIRLLLLMLCFVEHVCANMKKIVVQFPLLLTNSLFSSCSTALYTGMMLDDLQYGELQGARKAQSSFLLFWVSLFLDPRTDFFSPYFLLVTLYLMLYEVQYHYLVVVKVGSE